MTQFQNRTVGVESEIIIKANARLAEGGNTDPSLKGKKLEYKSTDNEERLYYCLSSSVTFKGPATSVRDVEIGDSYISREGNFSIVCALFAEVIVNPKRDQSIGNELNNVIKMMLKDFKANPLASGSASVNGYHISYTGRAVKVPALTVAHPDAYYYVSFTITGKQ